MTLIQGLSINYPVFGLLMSIFLLFGFYSFGSIICKNKYIYNLISEVSDVNYQKILIAVNFLSIILFPLLLFLRQGIYFLQSISIVIACFGVVQIIIFLRKIKIYKIDVKIINIENLIITSFIICYFVLSMSPITHPDALDYHADIAEFIATTGTFPANLNNLHNILYGSGEAIMALSFIFKSEQIGNLIQFSGLLSIIGLIRKNSKNKFLFSLIILSTPVIFFLCSSPKPQLLPLATNALVFTLVFFKRKNLFLDKQHLLYFAIIILIFLINSVNTKFSFILSSGILYIISLNYFYRKNFFKEFLYISITLFILFYLPNLIWKSQNWGGQIHNYLLSPFPQNLPGINNFENYLLNYQKDLPFIYLIIPQNLGTITNTVGISFVFLFLVPFLKNEIRLKMIIIILIFTTIVFTRGQATARFLIEPIFWLLIIVSQEKIKLNKLFVYLIYLQSVVGATIVIFGTYNLFPGALSKSYYNLTMTKYANGYELYSWSNLIIDNDKPVLSMHRSIFLGKNKTLSTSFLNYLSKDDDPEIYIREIQKYKPKYFLTFQSSIYEGKNNLSIFKNCLGKVVAKKENVGTYTARNPFNRKKSYAGLLYEFKTSNLLECVDMNLLKN